MIRWKFWNNFPFILFLSLMLFTPGRGQELADYFHLAYQGKVKEVQEALPQLYRLHPDDGSILFLEGLVTRDGDTAVEIFKRVAQLYPSSPYADDALLKIGEYLYARGLYMQAAQYLRRIPVHYPRSDLIYPGIRLFLNAMLVSGNRDTALFYSKVFARKYPDIEFDLDTGRAAGQQGDQPVIASPGAAGRDRPAERKEQAGKPPAPPATGSFRLQVGAYSVRANAERQKVLLQSLNYRVDIVETSSRGRTLHYVFVKGFGSREEAELAGELLKENYGIDYLVLRGK